MQWQPPVEEYVKCNPDAALFGDQQCFGIRMCIQNAQGQFIKALTKWFEWVFVKKKVVWVLSLSIGSRGIGIKGGYILALGIRIINGTNRARLQVSGGWHHE